MNEQPHDVTQLLQAWAGGDADAMKQLVPLVYRELHRLAHRHMVRERAGNSLQTTALVHEAYLRLAASRQVDCKNRIHFYAIAAAVMRRILVDFARTRGSRKRGGDVRRIALDEAAVVDSKPGADLVALSEALDRLAAVEPRQARVVELRFFGGLNQEETGEALAVSSDTVLRDWKKAKLWLWRELKQGGAE